MIHNGEMCSLIEEKKKKVVVILCWKKIEIQRISYTIYNMPYIFDSMVQYLIDV